LRSCGGTISTRNCRLAAIRRFFNFVATRDPASLAQGVEILNIPVRRAPVSEPCYLEPAEVAAILAQPNRSTIEGLRDHTLLSFRFNSGARIQEALDLFPNMIRFDIPNCVGLIGKGRKERICPLWPETVLLLKNAVIAKIASTRPAAVREPLWPAALRLGRAVQACGLCDSSDRNRAIAARQTCDTAQLPPRHRRASCLGQCRRHGHPQLAWPPGLDTTNHYAKENLETKRKALEQVSLPATTVHPPSWKRDTSLLVWLDTV
jgi:integrase